MRGFSSSFPRGGAGAGLLLLRLAVALQLLTETLCAEAAPWWSAMLPAAMAWLPLSLAVSLAVALALGVLTPVAGALGALWQLLCLAQSGWGHAPPCIVGALTAAALVLLGPGAYALDARLFGRRRLVLPASPADHNRF
ncbi:putative membrane protein YphA (DoxX/SURF4 family) [Duganella sp. 1411]|jgi:hypothetical protein|uniref:hypothetical protein n=1 Tax=Duganella sp. 1411 TaxID=2806572 RepID=UPI001AE98E8B|nr:hypothetical protein [Duganella sp. 1411]MBP1203393.1 putative membrane protein YphA (DoxX/SURF4 family) [Duganella sp. 1411]